MAFVASLAALAVLAGGTLGSGVVVTRWTKAEIAARTSAPVKNSAAAADPAECGMFQVRCDASLQRFVPSEANCTLGGCVDCTRQLQASGVNCAAPPSECTVRTPTRALVVPAHVPRLIQYSNQCVLVVKSAE